MAFGMAQKEESDLYCPMIDARRMEVYNAFFNAVQIRKLEGYKPTLLMRQSYKKELEKSVLFFGDGAEKCKAIIKHKNAKFLDGIYPTSKDMLSLVLQKYKIKILRMLLISSLFILKILLQEKRPNPFSFLT